MGEGCVKHIHIVPKKLKRRGDRKERHPLKEPALLHEKNRNARLRAKAEKALHDKSKVEPDFWTYFPNHEGRRDTMTAVLKALGQPKEATELMPAYAEWLLTAKKTHENGRPMNRWALMTAFVETHIVFPKPMLKPESVIVQMLVEKGDLVVGHTV